MGTENNIVTVRASDFEVFEALATDSVNSGHSRGPGRHYSKDEGRDGTPTNSIINCCLIEAV